VIIGCKVADYAQTQRARGPSPAKAAKTQGFDPVEIQAAVEKMVKGKAGRQSTQDWLSDDIKRKLKRPKKK
jgi:hypothetical protein